MRLPGQCGAMIRYRPPEVETELISVCTADNQEGLSSKAVQDRLEAFKIAAPQHGCVRHGVSLAVKLEELSGLRAQLLVGEITTVIR